MDFAPLTHQHKTEWAGLLAKSFERTPDDMLRLLDWLHEGHTIIGWGAWDGDELVAQYNCRMMELQLPGGILPAMVGMSINMAVDPEYRGQGLIKQVAQPVYEAVAACGGMAGVGFSNKQGVQVDLKSKSYGYQVVGQMQSVAVWLSPQRGEDLYLSDVWPTQPFAFNASGKLAHIHFKATNKRLEHRFGRHPFRQYAFGVWQEGDQIRGVVVYRTLRLAGIKGASMLAVYAAEPLELLRRWSAAVQKVGVRFIHMLTTPHATLRSRIRQLGQAVTLPYSRSPYYLTVKRLADTPEVLLDFEVWDCLGGDIL